MKRILFLIIFVFIISPAFADDIDDMGAIGDSLNYSKSFDDGFAGQEKVSDEAFQKALEETKAKQNKGKKKKFKGTEIHQENNSQHFGEIAEKNLLLSVTLPLINGDETEIPTGHYRIVGEKVNNNVYLDFYQSSKLIAKVPAIETKHDFGEAEINFVKLFPYNEKRIKIIYGSMDFNAYTFINIK